MEDKRRKLIVVIGAVIAFILHIVVAPALTLFSVPPNFLLSYVLVVAILQPTQAGLVMPFVLGIAYDLTGSGLVGGMALLFVVATFIVSSIFMVLDNTTLVVSLLVLIGSMFIVNMLYGFILIGCGISVSYMDAFLYRALPCSLYDIVAGLIFFPLMSRFLTSRFQGHELSLPHLR